jgi:hypothetical protein
LIINTYALHKNSQGSLMPKTLAQDALDKVSFNKEHLAAERGAARE